MRYRKKPLEYYRTLGLEPGASKREIRKAYLRLVKECHPDRLAHDPKEQAAAQEKLKEINQAYAFLKDYRPGGVDETWSYPEGATAQWHEYQRRTNHEPPIVDPFEGDYQYRPVRDFGKGSRFAWAFIALGLLIALRYIIFPSTSGMAGRRVSDSAGRTNPPRMQVVFLGEESRGNWSSSSRLVPYFFRGSTKSDVYRVQGIPDWSNEREWRYGDSRVYFSGDGVQAWKNGTRNPLKVIEPEDVATGNLLSVGATSRDVLAIQGAPDSITDSYWQSPTGNVTKTRVWHYGDAKVEFSDDKVVSWDAGSTAVLKVQRIKGLSDSKPAATGLKR